MPVAYSYIRMSTEKQVKGDSLRRQLEWSKRYADQHGLVLDDRLRDIGVSAWKGDNVKKGALSEFMFRVKEGSVAPGSYLLIESLDRLSRTQVFDAFRLFTDILGQQITIVTMDPEQVYTEASVNAQFHQLIIALTFMSRANEESERKSSRVRAAFANKRALSAKGVRTNSAVPSWITATRQPDASFAYELNERAPVVKRIFEMSADGIGVDKIARTLNEDGVPTLRNGKRGWWPNSVSVVLSNKAAMGEFQHTQETDGKREPWGDPIEDYYPSVVDTNLWQRAQKHVQRRSAGRGGKSFNNLFRGMCFCAHCGSQMYQRDSGKRKDTMHYLRCSNAMRNLGCTATGSFSYKHMEEDMLEYVREFGAAEIIRSRRDMRAIEKMQEQVDAARAKVTEVATSLDNLYRALELADDSIRDGFVERIRDRTIEQRAVKMALKELEIEFAQLINTQNSDDPTVVIEELKSPLTCTFGGDEEHLRYRLRSRVNAAFKEFVDFIDFDSHRDVYRVVMQGGLRAFEFDNRKKDYAGSGVPRFVDAMALLQMDTNPTVSNNALQNKLADTPYDKRLQPVNIRKGAFASGNAQEAVTE